ncbi:hypothetical protein [Campylobacter molothri]|uniref:hypothetical protein n=1 Tax=Campylobacter molothri TaxID=1032242 RepID=UPI00301BB99B|nr:hypothetical protein [Campylobacter sp. RM10534]
MRCVDAKNLVIAKVKNSYKMIEDDNVLKAYFMESFYYICSKCEPSVLLRNVEEDQRIFRQVRNNHFIIIPDEPDFSNESEHLMIDESLAFAVVNYVCYLASRCEEKDFLMLCNNIINEYIANDGKELDDEREWL